MVDRPKLQLIKPRDAYYHLLKLFREGKPLSIKQLNFLQWHHRVLSSEHFDSLVKYYKVLKKTKKVHITRPTLSIPFLISFREYLEKFLLEAEEGLEVEFTFKQFQQFKALGSTALIFYHGNPYLTGAPFYHGGIPHIDFFQWGNLYGVVKYHILLEENEIKGNVLVFFVEKQEELLEEFVKNYELTHRENTLTLEPTPLIQPFFPTPRLAFTNTSRNKELSD